MAFNGAGVFVRLYNWVNDAAASIKIRADRMDNEMAGFATGLTTCVTKDGQTTITANLPMATYRHTGVGDGASRTDYTSVGQTQDGKIHWVAAGGTADALTASYVIPITTLVDGQLCYVRALLANATATPTFAPSGLTARTIVKNGGQALVAGDIYGAGHELILRYYLSSTRWELLNPSVPAASTADMVLASVQTVTGAKTFGSAGAVGKLKIAGTTSGSTILDATAVASGTITLPASTGTVALIDSPTFTGTPAAPTASAGANTTQVATTAFVAAAVPNSSYRTLITGYSADNAGQVAGTYYICPGNVNKVVSGGSSAFAPPCGLYIASADYPTVNGTTPKLRLRVQLFTNDVGQTSNFTYGLYPVTRPGTSGASGQMIFTLGTVVSGSTVLFSAPAADGILDGNSGDFAFPSDGQYVIGCVTTATLAASSNVASNVHLQLRNA